MKYDGVTFEYPYIHNLPQESVFVSRCILACVWLFLGNWKTALVMSLAGQSAHCECAITAH